MVSFKLLLAVLPLALAMPSLPPSALEERACVPPTNCGGPIDVCEFCCAGGVVPNSANCHSHGETCPGGTAYHCDDEH
ncbi:hypothetical protein CSOJ01_01970 [Colletotrichum sojae]|uniref:Uncharacterized protein n=1 Tax=Colletotrichum sojae TaxID=2175907 RepID=A0A8H6N2W8_9PEZI|nr:hypothetical protein CSOJ01_01970 [Colletotrichum sojae]